VFVAVLSLARRRLRGEELPDERLGRFQEIAVLWWLRVLLQYSLLLWWVVQLLELLRHHRLPRLAREGKKQEAGAEETSVAERPPSGCQQSPGHELERLQEFAARVLVLQALGRYLEWEEDHYQCRPRVVPQEAEAF